VGVRGKIFAAMYDPLMRKTERAGLAARRRALLGAARGHVLEIGAGTGANLAHYGRAVESLTVTDPEAAMVGRLRAAARERAPDATVRCAPAEDLPFADEAFDVVVATLVLCSVDDLPAALREIRRVLRPDGRLLFLEHVRGEDPALARLQDRMNGFNRVVAGCHCNRSTLESLRTAGFDIVEVVRGTLGEAPRFVRPLVVGVATPAVPTTARTA
jgi:ubiquinone/menaquinone biosynthesis C-methylase UbiE